MAALEKKEAESASAGTSIYATRSNEGGMFGLRYHTPPSSTHSLLSPTTSVLEADMTELTPVEMTQQQKALLEAFRVLRALSIDLRLFVASRGSHDV